MAIVSLTRKDPERIAATAFVGSAGPLDMSGFWVLLTLAGVIASAGVVGDSTATVIGAMIVAPLMRPILGTACALVLADRNQLIRAVTLVLSGALAVISIGFLIGLITPFDISAATNSQVAARVSPRMIDLLAAVATGLVGAFALTRSDVADTLPGVAIAISLVPPLAVVGITFQGGHYTQSLGALLLFGTNVAAIIATSVVVLLATNFRGVSEEAGLTVGHFRGATLAIVVGALVLVAIPLGFGSYRLGRDQWIQSSAEPVVVAWAQQNSWNVTDVKVTHGKIEVRALGTGSDDTGSGLRNDLDKAGLTKVDLVIDFSAGRTVVLPGGD